MTIEPIGIIHSPFRTKEECPIQPFFAAEAIGRVELFNAFADGLKDIETFSHIYLLYQFDRAGEVQMVRPTFLDDEPRGIFASRHPCRPSGIGMSIVQLQAREGNVLVVTGIDVLDRTPLIDIKPYIPRYDRIDTANGGWTEGTQWRPKPTGRE